jgi:hypothetical protein
MEQFDWATFFTGFGVGVGLVGFYVYRRVESLIEQFIAIAQDIEEDLADEQVDLSIERDNGVFYCYNMADGTFICQGTNLAEIMQAFSTKFPDKKAKISGGDAEAISDLLATNFADKS